MTGALIAALVLSFVAALPAVSPEWTIDAKGTSAISAFLSNSVRRGDVPGVVVLVVSPDRVLYHEAFGKMQVLPFYDEAALGVLRGVEERVYQSVQPGLR